MTSEDEARLGETAALLMRDDVFKKIIQESEDEYLAKLLKCDPADDVGRYRYAEAIKVVRKVRRQLETYIESGKLARHQIAGINR